MYGSERKENELNITIIQVCIPKIKRLNKIYKNGTDHKSQLPALQSYRYGGTQHYMVKRDLNHEIGYRIQNTMPESLHQ